MFLKILFLISLSVSGCAHETIIYQCPPGQVAILENRGTRLERKVCYEPGVSYVDYRPITQEKIKNLGTEKKNG